MSFRKFRLWHSGVSLPRQSVLTHRMRLRCSCSVAADKKSLWRRKKQKNSCAWRHLHFLMPAEDIQHFKGLSSGTQTVWTSPFKEDIWIRLTTENKTNELFTIATETKHFNTHWLFPCVKHSFYWHSCMPTFSFLTQHSQAKISKVSSYIQIFIFFIRYSIRFSGLTT